jgi:hypothetical protein
LGGGCLIVLVIFIAKCVTEMRDRPKENWVLTWCLNQL